MRSASEDAPVPSASPAARRALVAVAVLVVAAALWLRTSSAADVFTPAGVRLLFDGDPYYHARRAWELVEGRGVLWHDPLLNFPRGADVPWPPLFDAVLAWTATALSDGPPSRERFLEIVAWVPVVLGAAGVLAGAALGAELLGAWGAVVVAAVLALLLDPAFFGVLGRPDQHVLEVLLFVLALHAYVRAARRPTVLAPLALGVVLALAFWTWPGTPVLVLFLLVAAAVARIVAAPDDPAGTLPARAIAIAGGAAAALLAPSIAVLGPPGGLTRFTLGGISGFAPAVAAGLAAGGLLLRLPIRRETVGGRAACVLGGGALAAAIGLAALPPVREIAFLGLASIGRARPFYSHIREFQPVLFSGMAPASSDLAALLLGFGIVPLLLLPAALELRHRWRTDPDGRSLVSFVVVLAAFYVPAAAMARRFGLYAVVPLALCAHLGLVWLSRVRRPALRFGALAACCAGIVAPAALREHVAIVSPARDALLDLSARLRDRGGPPGAVLAFWTQGHHLLWETGRPVLASPFGADGGEGSYEDLSTFFLEYEPARADRLLDARRVRYVLLGDPFPHVTAFALDHPERAPIRFGESYCTARPTERFRELLVARLYADLGAEWRSSAAIGNLRLVDESERIGRRERLRLFERVAGARLRVSGLEPGRKVTAEVHLSRPGGESAAWRTSAEADSSGAAELRVPYATGGNGRVIATSWQVSDGRETALVDTSEADVVRGGEVPVSLSRAVVRAGARAR